MAYMYVKLRLWHSNRTKLGILFSRECETTVWLDILTYLVGDMSYIQTLQYLCIVGSLSLAKFKEILLVDL